MTQFARLSSQINSITKILDLPRNTHLSRHHWAMAFTHALKLKNCLPSTLPKGRTPISFWQSEVIPLQPYGAFVAAHISLETQANGSGRSVGFSEHHRGGTLVFDPHNHYPKHIQSYQVGKGTASQRHHLRYRF